MATHTTLNSLFVDIADEIRAKKGTSETIVADNFPTEIANLPSGGDPSEYFNTNPTAEELATPNGWVQYNYIKKYDKLIIPDSISNISYLCSTTNSILSYAPKVICNNNVTNISYLYNGNNSKYIDVSGLDTSNVTIADYLFYQCKSLKEVDISSMDLMKVRLTNDGVNFFRDCYNLEKVIITSKISNTSSNLRNWFRGCYSLKMVVILKNDRVHGYESTFLNCYHMDGTVNTTYNPEGLRDGRIYVPDSLVDSYKSATNWANYGDQILPLSQYVEEN